MAELATTIIKQVSIGGVTTSPRVLFALDNLIRSVGTAQAGRAITMAIQVSRRRFGG